MSRSPRTVTQTSTTAPPAWLQQQQQDFLGRARGLSEQEYTPYTGQLVQGLTSDQTQARQMLRDRIASGGSQQFRDGRDTLNSIIGGGSYTAPGANEYLGRTTSFDPSNPMLGQRAQFSGQNPFAGQRVTAGQNAFLGGTTQVGANDYLGRTTDVARNRFLDENNPYLGQVIDSTLGDVTRAFNQQQAPQQLAQFAMGGAFGGSAHLQAMGESQRALAQELGRTATGLRSDDFNARRQLAESEAERLTSTRLADIGRNAGLAQEGIALRANIAQGDLSRNAELSQRGIDLQAGLDQRGLDRDADLFQRNAEFGADLADRGISRDADLFQRSNEFGANLRQNDLARNADLAGQGIRNEMDARQFADSQRLSALGLLPGFEDTGIRDIQALNAMGAEERDYLQQLLAAQYGQFIDQRDWDVSRLGIYGNALGGIAPSYQNSTSTGANPNYQSMGQQIFGGGLALLGLGI